MVSLSCYLVSSQLQERIKTDYSLILVHFLPDVAEIFVTFRHLLASNSGGRMKKANIVVVNEGSAPPWFRYPVKEYKKIWTPTDREITHEPNEANKLWIDPMDFQILHEHRRRHVSEDNMLDMSSQGYVQLIRNYDWLLRESDVWNMPMEELRMYRHHISRSKKQARRGCMGNCVQALLQQLIRVLRSLDFHLMQWQIFNDTGWVLFRSSVASISFIRSNWWAAILALKSRWCWMRKSRLTLYRWSTYLSRSTPAAKIGPLSPVPLECKAESAN